MFLLLLSTCGDMQGFMKPGAWPKSHGQQPTMHWSLIFLSKTHGFCKTHVSPVELGRLKPGAHKFRYFFPVKYMCGGSASALGGWSPRKVALCTSASNFPLWSSAHLPADWGLCVCTTLTSVASGLPKPAELCPPLLLERKTSRLNWTSWQTLTDNRPASSLRRLRARSPAQVCFSARKL